LSSGERLDHRELSVREVAVPSRPLSQLEPLIGIERFSELRDAAASVGSLMSGKTVWNVSSTSAGGGVAEMLQVLVGYALDASVDIRWLVMSGDPEFFALTKRIHNRLHGATGDPGSLGAAEARHYDAVTASNAKSVLKRVQPGDVVLLHDPQTAGLAEEISAAGASVIWRCHVGHETSNEFTHQAWSFLRPYLAHCAAYVFSVRSYAPEWVEEDKLSVIPPSIDPFSPKNQELSAGNVLSILGRIGALPGAGSSETSFVRRDGGAGTVQRHASILAAGSPALRADDRLVLQVSRWDRLKDMAGVMEGFVEEVCGRIDAHLALVGPSVAEVSDDPEGAEVMEEVISAWEVLPLAARRRVLLVTLPMEDIDENAAMVNALQRHATVVVQKSLAEGFGLTVAEAMWKAKPVVASAVGGIVDQVVPGTGILIEDPTDLGDFGQKLASLLERPDELAAMGERARRHVLDGFVGDRHLMQYAHLIQGLAAR